MGELVGPELVPERVVFTVGNARVEPDFSQLPPLRFRDRGSQGDGIEIGKRSAESFPCGVIEVLAVKEHDGSFWRWFECHSAGPKKRITHRRAFAKSGG